MKLDNDNFKERCEIDNYAKAGDLFKVLHGFSAESSRGISDPSDPKNKHIYKTTKFIEKDSIIEFRYAYDAHCRDTDDDYWRIDPSILMIKCKRYGTVHDKVRFENKLELTDILIGEHYYKSTEF